jgi:glucose-1-phosphate cytidylyltransferase
LTYGVGVGDVNVKADIALHQKEKRLATVTAVQPPGRFGAIEYDAHRVVKFQEKPQGDGAWINGGFFVLSPKVIDYIDGDQAIWEREPMQRLAEDGQMSVYFHQGFWQPMDTLREKYLLEELWQTGKASWRVWE